MIPVLLLPILSALAICDDIAIGQKLMVEKAGFERLQFGENSLQFFSDSDQVRRNLLIYLPRSIEDPSNLAQQNKALIFLHGGGASTNTRESALSTAQLYLEQYVNYSEQNKAILILPTSPVGWNAHTSFLLRNLVNTLPSRIAINPNQIALAGHSMGGMGITREFPSITDLFSGVFVQSAGHEEKMLTQDLLLPYFNGTRYVHLNGRNDHFQDFLPRLGQFQTHVKALAASINRIPKVRIRIHDGGHSPPQGEIETMLDLTFETTRNLYPKYLNVEFNWTRVSERPNYPQINAFSDRKYWLKIKGVDTPRTDGVHRAWVEASVQGQEIRIKTRNDQLSPESIELRLSDALVDMQSPVTIYVNDVLAHDGKIATHAGDTVAEIELPLR